MLHHRRILLSGSSDQILRFWDLDDIQAQKPPLFKMHAGHDLGVKFNKPIPDPDQQEEEEEGEERAASTHSNRKAKPYLKRYNIGEDGWSLRNQLTAVNVDSTNNKIVTADTMGRLKLHDITRVDFKRDQNPAAKIRVPWFVNAHKLTVNQVSIVEQKEESEDEEEDEASQTPDESENAIPDEPRIEWPDMFVLSCSQDYNILLHRLSNGVKIG